MATVWKCEVFLPVRFHEKPIRSPQYFEIYQDQDSDPLELLPHLFLRQNDSFATL